MSTDFQYIRQPEAITAHSFEIIRAELAARGHTLAAGAEGKVVERVIHSTADFDFADNLRFYPGATAAIIAALRQGSPIITDARMVEAGLNRRALGALGVKTACYIDHPQAQAEARQEGITVSMTAMRLAARNHAGQNPIFAIGNAPTALFELLALVEAGAVQPAAIIGMPVGFVSVVESKEALMKVTTPPWITSVGRKGGSSATAGAVNALLLLAADL